MRRRKRRETIRRLQVGSRTKLIVFAEEFWIQDFSYQVIICGIVKEVVANERRLSDLVT
jgi:hypothetical protein